MRSSIIRHLHILLPKVILLFLISSPTTVFAQNLFPDPGEVFRDDVVPRIDIIIPENSLDAIYAPGNEQSDFEWMADFIFDNGTIRDTVENIGFRLRGNTSRYSDKKSFKVSFNTYEPGRKYYGLEKMNLNGEHNDPSIMRAKVCWDLVRDMEIPGSRSNHVVLYINGDFFGVYINVEHIDEEFVDLRYGTEAGNLYKCLWPADMNYLGPDPEAYKFMNGNRRTYDLITNTEEDDYSDIAHLIDVLNNTPTNELACELEPIFNVHGFLKAVAFDILSGNWDGPLFNKNNFYLYNDPVSGQFQYIPYDLDNTFGIDWFGEPWVSRNIYFWANQNQPRPLYWNIIAVPEYRVLFNFYMKSFLEDQYNPVEVLPRIDQLKSQIAPFVPDDIYYTYDYGFSVDDFHDSYIEQIPYNHTKYGLKPFIEDRHYWTEIQLDGDIPPLVFNIENTYPEFGEGILVTAEVVDFNEVTEVELCYFVNSPPFTCTQLFDDGQHNDGFAGDGLYGGFIPPVYEESHIEYYIKATDEVNWESQFPICDNKKISLGVAPLPIYVNEVMAKNESTIADEAGEYDDWVELYYTGSEPLDLSDKYLSDDENNPTKWKFKQGSMIYPFQFLIVWLDDDVDQGQYHANFKLSAGGEFIGIFHNETHGHSLINGFDFDEQTEDVSYGRIPNGTGSLVLMDPTPGASNTPNATSDPTADIAVSISPNPFNDQFHFRFEDGLTRNIRWKLTNALGRQVMSNTILQNTNAFYVKSENLNPGLYFLTVETQEGLSITRKVVYVK
ncbi:MAG: T9SS C-terminal target domain-containing protein [Bacteroidetes bacterium]|nr:MAG: T9SS C-terminal target domain-containing protein [Bacteroidota bacterium]